jgi:hypothetical protein
MYIASLSLTVQGEATGLVCPVKVEWSFGPKTPDLVEVYLSDPGQGAERLAQVQIDEDRTPTATTVTLPAGQPAVRVFAAPRLLDDTGTPEDLMPDAAGVPRDWQAFALSATVATPARQGTGEVKVPPRAAPSIDRLELLPPRVLLVAPPSPVASNPVLVVKLPSRIRVHWSAADDFGKYLVRWVTSDPRHRPDNPQGVDIEKGGRSGVYELKGAIPGLDYWFNVKGGWGWPVPHYTDWSSAQRTLAHPPFRGLREYLRVSGIDPSAGVRRYLQGDGGSVRSFMQLGAG